MLSFGLAVAATFDGERHRLEREGADPAEAMAEAAEWVRGQAGEARRRNARPGRP